MKRRLFLVAWLNSSGFRGDSWDHAARDRARIFTLDHYLRHAEIAHRGVFDAVFLADQPQLTPDPRVRPEYPLDPIVLLTAITSRVPDIGAIATATTSFNHPYTLARQLASLNLLSGGRVAWNAVTTVNPVVARNYGAERLDRDDRYARADEFLGVVNRLWRSWRFDWAHSAEPAENPFGEVTPLEHRGEHFGVAGALPVPLPPYGAPVVVQAGGSPQGRALAAKWGELIYAAPGSRRGAIAYAEELRAGARRNGRPEGSVAVLPGFQPLIGSTEEEVARLIAEYEATLAPEQDRVRGMAERLGIDLERTDLDRPLREADFHLPEHAATPLGALRATADIALEERLSLRGLARRLSVLPGTPEHLADRIIDWWSAGAADGFVVNSPLLPDTLERFVDEVIPVLQRREVFPTSYTETNLRARFGFPVA